MDMQKIPDSVKNDPQLMLLWAQAEVEAETQLIEEEVRLRSRLLGISMTPRTDPNKKENEPEKNG